MPCYSSEAGRQAGPDQSLSRSCKLFQDRSATLQRSWMNGTAPRMYWPASRPLRAFSCDQGLRIVRSLVCGAYASSCATKTASDAAKMAPRVDASAPAHEGQDGCS